MVASEEVSDTKCPPAGHVAAHGSHVFYFFFQAEDGIRDVAVTGVQTCALPISQEAAMKDGIRFVDSDMHVMEPPDLFDRYLDPRFKHRVSVPVGADGRPNRGPSGLIIIDGEPTSDMDLQQYRKRVRPQKSQSTQLLSGSRIFDTGRLDFAIERHYH